MSPSQDDTLREATRALDRLAAQTAADLRPSSRIARLLRRHPAAPVRVKPVAVRKRNRRSDFMTAALGVTLCLICALFPWYIFFNPEEFGVRAITFGGSEALGEGIITLGQLPDRVGAPSSVEQTPQPDLDLLATGTTPAHGEEDVEEQGTLGLSQQPFPAPPIVFKLVHVANGRAMIEDDSGLFVVQVGSMLPDSTHVTSIEERAGRWVMVSDEDTVHEMQP